MNSKSYKYCCVPLCHSTTIKTPKKIFVNVPSETIIREDWMRLARASIRTRSKNLYFCEDHFDLPNDMENFMEYHVMGYVSQIRMKPGCIPTKFECQTERKKCTFDTGRRSYIRRKPRKTLIEESLEDSAENKIITNNLDLGGQSSGSKVVQEDRENIEHEDNKTAEVFTSEDIKTESNSLPNDMRNYIQQCRPTGSVPKLVMESKCVPIKFQCQSDKISNPIKRPNILKRRRKTLVEECEKDLEEPATNSDVAYILEPIEYNEETHSKEAAVEDSRMTDEEYEIIGKSIGLQLRDLSKKQLTITQKIISDAIYYAKIGALTERSVIALEEPNILTGESKVYQQDAAFEETVHAESSSTPTAKVHDNDDNSSHNSSPQYMLEPQSPDDSIVKIEYEDLEIEPDPQEDIQEE